MNNFIPSNISSTSTQKTERDNHKEWTSAASLLDGLCAAVHSPDGEGALLVVSTAPAHGPWTLRCTDLHTVWAHTLDAGAFVRAAAAAHAHSAAEHAAHVAAAFRAGRVTATAVGPTEAVLALPEMSTSWHLEAVRTPGAAHALVADLVHRVDVAPRAPALAQGPWGRVPAVAGGCVGATRRARVHSGAVKRTRPGGARIVADAEDDDSDDVGGL